MSQPLPRRQVSDVLASGTFWMVAGTVGAAFAAYVFQLVAGRALGPTDFAPITVLWTIQFLVFFTVFLPMEQLTIRRLSAAAVTDPPRRLFGSVIVAAVVASVAFGALTLDSLLDGQAVYLAVIAVLIAVYGLFALGRGVLAGRLRYRDYGLATLAESAGRLVLAALLLAVGAGVVGVAWSLAAGAVLIYLWRPFRDETPIDVPHPPGAATDLATFIAANAAAQTIVAAGPLVVGALGAAPAEVSVFFETFLLFRGPLTVAYNVVARVLPPFTRLAEEGGGATLARWAKLMTVAGLLVAGAGFALSQLIGPDLVAVLFGEEFRPSGLLAAYAATGVVIATIALFSQQILIAYRRTGLLALAWVTGLVAAVITIAVSSGSESLRVGLAFVVGEGVAMLLITATAMWLSKQR